MTDSTLVPPGSRVRIGSSNCTVTAVGYWGERMYFTRDAHGVIAMWPASVIESADRSEPPVKPSVIP